MKDKFLKDVFKYIDDNKMLEDFDSLLVGLSGGADSTCLLLVLSEYKRLYRPNLRLIACHINHMIRGDEAYRDQEFARQLALGLECEFVLKSIDVPALADKEKLSEEEAGRDARYKTFAELADSYEAGIAVAHHLNDQAETILMHMLRGAGLGGMTGMRPVSGRLIRPLLGKTRDEIEDFLAECGQDFITDSTNLENEYSRNKFRNIIMPKLDEAMPGAVRHIAELGTELASVDDFIDKEAKQLMARFVDFKESAGISLVTIKNIEELREFDSVLLKRLLLGLLIRLAGNSKDIYRAHVLSLYDLLWAQSGKMINLPYSMTARKSFENIYLERSTLEKGMYKKDMLEKGILDKGIPEKGMLKEDLGPMSPVEKDDVQGETDLYRLPFIEAGNFEKRLDFGAYKIEIQILTQNEEFNYRDNMVTKIFDYDKINNTLVFRRRQIGDYMVINKEGNKAKLKKIFIEKKIDESQRDKILLLALDDTSQVLLADGVRRCFGYHVDKESKRILLIRKIDS